MVKVRLSDVLEARRSRVARIELENEKLKKAIAEVVGCFDAAEAEGLSGVLMETTDGLLKDIVTRRLLVIPSIVGEISS